MADITLDHILSISNTTTDKIVKMTNVALHLNSESREVANLLAQLRETHDRWLKEQQIGSTH